jgi:hypothetical protein
MLRPLSMSGNNTEKWVVIHDPSGIRTRDRSVREPYLLFSACPALKKKVCNSICMSMHSTCYVNFVADYSYMQHEVTPVRLLCFVQVETPGIYLCHFLFCCPVPQSWHLVTDTCNLWLMSKLWFNLPSASRVWLPTCSVFIPRMYSSLQRVLSSEIQRRVLYWKSTYVSEEYIFSNFRVE